MEKKSLGFVLMLDVSYSMVDVIDMVKIDSKAFVRQARPKDQFGINQFSDNASWVYPAGNNPNILTVSPDLHETKDSLAYIENIKVNNLTNIGGAIDLGNKMINGAGVNTDLKAFVLLSDGAHNVGTNPVDVLGNQPPIYIAGLGDLYTPYFEQLIKKNPKSKFYNKPNAYQMMLMFNEIVADSSNAELTLNNLKVYNKGSDYYLEKFQVSSKDNASQLNVVWSNKKYQYTPSSPQGNQINIVLIDPDNKNTTIKPDIVEEGYCIYNLNNIKPGEWKVLTQYSVGENLTGTIGGVAHFTNVRSKLSLPTIAKKNEPFDIKVNVLDENNPIENVKVTAKILKPKVGIDKIMSQYQDELERLDLSDIKFESYDKNAIGLNLLRNNKIRNDGYDIFMKKLDYQQLSMSKDGDYSYTLDNITEDGIYNIEIKIEGINPKTGLPFTSIKTGSTYIK